MNSNAIILVSVSAFAHAFWNLLSKRENPTAAFFFVASTLAALCFSPLLVIFRETFALIPPRVWIWLGLTTVFETIYYIGLAGAYRHGDMSVAYPLARALPVMLVAILTATIGLGEPLNLVGAAGIVLVIIGCLFLPQRSLRQINLKSFLTSCCLLASVAGVGTAGYTLVDNQALLDLRSMANIDLNQIELAFFYLALESVTVAIMLGGCVLISRTERDDLDRIRRTGKRIAFFTGLLILGTYGLVLAAMTYASNVSYIAAFRQLSIPLGAILGVTVQKEPAYISKLASIGIIFAGLIMIMLT